jgi:carbonic anhydrase
MSSSWKEKLGNQIPEALGREIDIFETQIELPRRIVRFGRRRSLDAQVGQDLAALCLQAVEANVRWSMRQILETPEGRERQTEGLLKLVGAVTEIETGRVRFLA